MDFTKRIIPLALIASESIAIDSEPIQARGIIVEYSPASGWIMCELSFFPIFLENDLLKVDKNPRVDFFLRPEKTFSKGSKQRFSIYCN